MKILKFVVLLILFMNCCTSNKSNESIEIFKESIGKKLIIPEELEKYNLCNNSIEKQYTIYVGVNVSCGECLNNIEFWEDFINSELGKFYNLNMICHSEDDFHLLGYWFESKMIGDISFPLYLDRETLFIEKNPFIGSSKLLTAVIVDNENTILAIGNPSFNDKLLSIYEEIISFDCP